LPLLMCMCLCYIGFKITTLGKAYGTKWTMNGDMLGNNKNSTPPQPFKKEKKRGFIGCMLQFFIGWTIFLIHNYVHHLFWPSLWWQGYELQ
jgi:hypothetical protein